MKQVTVYLIEIYAPSEHGETKIADRWFTRSSAELMKPIRILEASAIQIPASDLEDKAEWTPRGYKLAPDFS
jgi:hypothetical protein